MAETIDRLTSSERAWWDSRAERSATVAEVVATGSRPTTAATQALLDRVVTRMLARARQHRSCVDAGCGVGLYIPLLTRLFSDVIALDFSPNVVRRIPAAVRDRAGVKLINGSVTHLPLRNDAADAVFCRSTFQCLPAALVPAALQEFHRVLSPGGVVVLHFKNSHHLLYRLSHARSMLRFWRRGHWDEKPDEADNGQPGRVYHRPWHSYLQQCRNAGFAVEDEFSWQFFYSGRMNKMRGAKAIERAERWARQFRPTEWLIRRDGINYYVLLRKPDR